MTSTQKLNLIGVAGLLLGGCASNDSSMPTPQVNAPQTNQVVQSPASPVELCEQQSAHQVALSQCLQDLMAKADQELQVAENKQLAQQQELAELTGRDKSLKALKESVEAFKTYRQSQCIFGYEALMPGSGAAIYYKKCYINLTEARTSQLNQL